MGSAILSVPNWVNSPPSAFDIVTGYYPETKPKHALRLRPLLVLNVYKNASGTAYACDVTFGTKNIKFVQRKHLDIIIQNSVDLGHIGLPMATRFDLDEENIARLPWDDEFFGCWTGRSHPKLGSLPEPYVKDYVFFMALRQANKKP